MLSDEEINAIVREASKGSALRPMHTEPTSVRIARAIEAAVIERCAQVVDKYAKANMESDIMVDAFTHCAAAIRGKA